MSKELQGIRCIDLFAGIGGFHLAVSAYGADVIYASEWDKAAADVYEKNFGIIPFGDITKINEADIPSHDILCAGWPCQPFSISGSRKGFEDSRGTLFFDIARIVKEKKPKVLFLENVKNLTVHDGGRTLQVVVDILQELGYVVHYKVLNSSDYGIPQSRKRIYFVCVREDAPNTDYEWPQKKKLKKHVEDMLQTPQETKQYIINRRDVVLKDVEEKYADRPIRVGTVGKGGQGERIYSIKGTAITLSAYGGGVGAKTGLYKVGNVIRRLSPRECANLMGFPKKFRIAENRNDAYQQFGNSVVVDVLKAILGEIVKDKEKIEWLQDRK